MQNRLGHIKVKLWRLNRAPAPSASRCPSEPVVRNANKVETQKNIGLCDTRFRPRESNHSRQYSPAGDIYHERSIVVFQRLITEEATAAEVQSIDSLLLDLESARMHKDAAVAHYSI